MIQVLRSNGGRFMQVMIIGCGKIGRELAIELLELGEEVVVVDRDQINSIILKITTSSW